LQVKEITREIEDVVNDINKVEEQSKHILKIAKASSEDTNEVAASVQEQSASMEEILASICIVAEMAEELQNIVLRFKV